MADAEKVFTKGSVLVMNQRGLERALSVGAEKINIVFSPCEEFNMKNFGKTRSELITMYYTMLNGMPKNNIRVYISMAFGSPYTGIISPKMMELCIKDAKILGKTVVFSDTIGMATKEEVALWADIAKENNLKAAIHIHHNGDEAKALSTVRYALLEGIKEIDSSIGGLGGCPFVEESGANLSTETLVRHLEVWGFDCGFKENKLKPALKIVKEIKYLQNVLLVE
jgi:hydroxymethylglutaryl-CoA lyase